MKIQEAPYQIATFPNTKSARRADPCIDPGKVGALIATSPEGLSVKAEGTLHGPKEVDFSLSYGRGEVNRDSSPHGKPAQGISAGRFFGREEPGITASVIGQDSNRITLAGGLGETATIDGFTPYVSVPPLPDLKINSTVRPVDGINRLLMGGAEDTEAYEENLSVCPSSQREQQTKSTVECARAVTLNAAKKIFDDREELLAAEAIDCSQLKNSLLRADVSVLGSDLLSRKEETLGTVKDFAITVSDRIAYSINPYARPYMDDKKILQLRATQKDEGASLAKEELGKEKDALQKRLKELQLLIEDSTRLTKWFEGKAYGVNSTKLPTSEATLREVSASI